MGADILDGVYILVGAETLALGALTLADVDAYTLADFGA